MTPNHDFTNAKVGDPIHTVQWGEGTIIVINKHDHYPIIAQFSNGTRAFTTYGKDCIKHSYPTAFTEPIKVVPASYEAFQEQEMMVWDDDYGIEEAYQRVVFANPRGKFVSYSDAKTLEEVGIINNVVLWDNVLSIAEWEAKVKESKNQQEITEIENQIAELQAKLEKLKG